MYNAHSNMKLTGLSAQLTPYSAMAACLSAIMGPRI